MTDRASSSTTTCTSISVNAEPAKPYGHRDGASGYITVAHVRRLLELADETKLPDDALLLIAGAAESAIWQGLDVVTGIGVRHLSNEE